MNTSSGVSRFAGCQPSGGGLLHVALLLGVAMFFVGCGKKSETPPVTTLPTESQTNQAAVPPAAPGAVAVSPSTPATNVAAAPNAGPDLGALNQALRGWLMRNRRVPASFEEFASTAGVTIPPPPAGKKYAITKRMEVVLVNR